MPNFTGGAFRSVAAKIMGGKTHMLWLGDSQHTFRLKAPTVDMLMRRVLYHLNPHYMVGPGASASQAQTMFYTAGYLPTSTDMVTTTIGASNTEFNYGSGTPVLGREASRLIPGINLADNFDMTNGVFQGMQLQRMQSNNSATNANLAYPWNLSNGNNRPWYHSTGGSNTHIKTRLLIQAQSSGGWLQIDTASRRCGLTTSTLSAFNTCTIPATETIVATDWTAPHADGGGYQTSTSGNLNDHYIQATMRATAGYNENGLRLLIPGWMVTRCDSGGTIPWNSDNTGLGIDTIGRAGANCENWASNYWSQTQWQQYLAATVLVPNADVTVCIMLGHNVNGTGEQSGNLVTATWSTNYQAIIDKIRNGFLAAFPTGTIRFMLIVPWRCTEEATFMNSVASCQSLQTAVEALAAANGAGWFSYFNYFNQLAPIPKLHAETEYHGSYLAAAIRDALDRGTDFAYTPGGSFASGSTGRNWSVR
jgi:hypothetical protein